MGTCDLAVQLHFALFNGTTGFVLKPLEMKAAKVHGWQLTSRFTSTRLECGDDENYWPPPCDWLYLTTVRLLSLHACPKHGEQRPGYNGSRCSCHNYHRQELSGLTSRPEAQVPSSPILTLSLHPVGGECTEGRTEPLYDHLLAHCSTHKGFHGSHTTQFSPFPLHPPGFCSVSKTLPLPMNVETEASTCVVEGNGLNAGFDGETVHCAAAEPHATFLRVAVTDAGSGGTEVAYETAVLGRLRSGYRVLQLRSSFGTRIELCYLLVQIRLRMERSLFATPRQLRVQSSAKDVQNKEQRRRIEELEAMLAMARHQTQSREAESHVCH